MRIAVYTCVTGAYDQINEVPEQNLNENIDFICYTNNRNLKSNSWQVKYLEDNSLTNVQLARKVKILGTDELKKYDVVIWHDADISWKTSIKDFIKKFVDLKKYDLITLKHHSRDCVSDEILACFEFGKIDNKTYYNVMDYYKQNKYNDNVGLAETGVIFRNFNNERVVKAMELWFDHIINLTHRDQLSFNYVAYKSNLKINMLPINPYHNEYFNASKHSKNATISVVFKKNKKYLLSNITIDGGGLTEIRITPEYDTDGIKLVFNSKYGIVLKSISCKSAKKIINNCDEYNGKHYSSFSPMVIELTGSFKKGSEVSITLDFDAFDIFDLTYIMMEHDKIINDLVRDNDCLRNDYENARNDINKYRNDADRYKDELNSVLNSTSMKITKPLRAVKRIVKKKND